MADLDVHAAADHDAVKIGDTGNDIHKEANAYHDAYTNFANDAYGSVKSGGKASPQDQIGQYQKDMQHDLGSSRVGQLELVWAQDHTNQLTGAQQRVKHGRTSSEEINGDKLKDVKPNSGNSGADAFTKQVAGDLDKRYQNDEFSSYRHSITNQDLSEKSTALGKEADGVDAARKEAKDLFSPLKTELVDKLKDAKGDGPKTLYDLLKEPDGSVKKYGYGDGHGTRLSQIENDKQLSKGDLTPEQQKAVDNLYKGFNDDPLKDQSKGAVTPDSIKKATDLDLPELSISGQSQKPAATAPDVQKAADVQKAPETHKPDEKKPQETPIGPDAHVPLPVPRPTPAEPASHTIKLGQGPLLDQIGKDMREHNQGKEVTPEEVRSQLAKIAKANKWPGSEEQWNNYVKDGSTKHLPKQLNKHLRHDMDITVPN